MKLALVLDTGPLGKVTNPKSSPENDAAAYWLQSHIDAGTGVIIPEIANYELRRELVLGGKVKGLNKLDALIELVEYLPLTTEAVYEAAFLWADARRAGIPTAHSQALDGDMLLVGQVSSLGADAVVATVDVGDLPLFTNARLWSDIHPEN